MATIVYKRCRKCSKKKDVRDFYVNPKWKEEMCRDTWCKACISTLVIDEKSVIEYFSDNRRLYREGFWNKTYAKVKGKVETEFPYITGRRKMDLVSKKTRIHIFKLINMNAYYKFIDDFNGGDSDNSDDEGDANYDRYKAKEYNSKWVGYYTKEELDYLENYYNGLDRDFNLSNQSYIDYAKKVSKASLAMDISYSDMQRGVDGASKRYNDMKGAFDSLSQSAKFAEKTRSANDATGFGSLGELIAAVENGGFLIEPVTFPDDDVDGIIADFRYIIASIGENI